MQQEQKQGQPPEQRLCTPSVAIFFILLIALMLHCDGLFAEGHKDEQPKSPWSVKQWTVQTSVYTWHWDPEPEHNNQQHLLAVESHFNNHWLVGAAVFRNSFDQSSQLLYMGKKWDLFESQYWYFKVTGGLLHGYKEPYEDKIPYNGLGVAPVLIPSVGFRLNHLIIETTFAGIAAVTITAGLSF